MNDLVAVQRSERFFSKRRLAWAGLAAVGGCAASCAVPLVVALGLGGGAAAAIASVLRPGTELLVGGGAFASALALMAVRSFLTRKVTPATVDAGCGCGPGARSTDRLYGSPKAAGNEPVACTFDMRDMAAAQAHIDGYRSAFARLLSAERFPGGFRWVFRAEPGLETQLKNLAEREHECCRFFNFDLTSDGHSIIWETTADPIAESVLEQYFVLPETLGAHARTGQDLSVLKHVFAGSGLAFNDAAGPGARGEPT